MNNLPSLRLPQRGMQVHSVPEHEKYIDSQGKRLPWAYERADLPDHLSKRDPVEQGPFGRSNRRRGTSRSRSKTAEPRREEDVVKAENAAAEDIIFGRLKVDQREKDSASESSNAAAAKPEIKEPTEVLLYGFAEDLMWSAIDFYERVSSGIILEDYERQPPGRQEPLSRSLSRATAQKSLTRASLRRKNTFVGGKHWIKVTFNSAEAADLAVARSPHTIKGHLIYAEPYRGSGPAKDEPIFGSSAGAQITSDSLPKTFSTTNKSNSSPTPSATVSSATIDGAQRQAESPTQAPRSQHIRNALASTTSTALQQWNSQSDSAMVQRTSRIAGATPAVLLPAERALLPRSSQSYWWPYKRDASRNTEIMLPKRADGALDWEKASLYWRIFWWIDFLLGTDLCGLKGDD